MTGAEDGALRLIAPPAGELGVCASACPVSIAARTSASQRDPARDLELLDSIIAICPC